VTVFDTDPPRLTSGERLDVEARVAIVTVGHDGIGLSA
jgi:hypothetical protein